MFESIYHKAFYRSLGKTKRMALSPGKFMNKVLSYTMEVEIRSDQLRNFKDVSKAQQI